ncbi:MAG: hypothetical protein A4E35_01252 [Methanoregula sp. PtaU1.Bin051]|nr:MAG: hypothetical protein A4E35_01252 [Methanoregula sp. PtaU1.Bin051]
MDHSYEEIRKATLDILSGRERSSFTPNQFVHLRIGVAEVLHKRDGTTTHPGQREPQLTQNDQDLFQEVFWDLFRQNIITLGTSGDPNAAYPWFRVSSFGKKALANDDVYFFHDLTSYEKIIRENIPDIDEITLFYLKEAMQAFIVGCRLSSAVMLGVALEYSLDILYEVINQNGAYSAHFQSVSKEPTLFRKFNKFKQKLNEKKSELPKELREDLDINLDMIVSLIRNYRNESGHPTGAVISREQCYVNLQLFIPCCKKIYELMAYYR